MTSTGVLEPTTPSRKRDPTWRELHLTAKLIRGTTKSMLICISALQTQGILHRLCILFGILLGLTLLVVTYTKQKDTLLPMTWYIIIAKSCILNITLRSSKMLNTLERLSIECNSLFMQSILCIRPTLLCTDHPSRSQASFVWLLVITDL